MDKSQIEELRKLKTLLNEGIITREEFTEARDNLIKTNSDPPKSVSEHINQKDDYKENTVQEATSKQDIKKEELVEEQIAQETIDAEQVDAPSDIVGNNENKKPKAWQILLVGLVVTFVVLFAIAGTGAFDKPVEWSFEESQAQKMTYGKVTTYVPSDWEVFDIDNGKEAMFEGTVWLMIDDRGKFASMDELKKNLEESSIPYDGPSVDIKGTQYAIKINEYTNDDGETIKAFAVLVDGEGYWVGGGAKEKSLQRKEFNEMLEHIQYNGK